MCEFVSTENIIQVAQPGNMLVYNQKARMSRIYYLRNRSLLGHFAA